MQTLIPSLIVYMCVYDTLSQCPCWMHAGKISGKVLWPVKPLSREKKFTFSTSQIYIKQFSSPRWNCWIIDILRWISELELDEFNPINFTSVISLRQSWYLLGFHRDHRVLCWLFSLEYWIRFLWYDRLVSIWFYWHFMVSCELDVVYLKIMQLKPFGCSFSRVIIWDQGDNHSLMSFGNVELSGQH